MLPINHPNHFCPSGRIVSIRAGASMYLVGFLLKVYGLVFSAES